ncbi:MAG: hypothetical protein ACRCYD_05895 [Plesiomonas sp.]
MQHIVQANQGFYLLSIHTTPYNTYDVTKVEVLAWMLNSKDGFQPIPITHLGIQDFDAPILHPNGIVTVRDVTFDNYNCWLEEMDA